MIRSDTTCKEQFLMIPPQTNWQKTLTCTEK